MAHYVAKVLKIRPSEILDTWGCAELMVAFGQYANEKAEESYQTWYAIHGPGKKKKDHPKPKRYVVEFING